MWHASRRDVLRLAGTSLVGSLLPHQGNGQALAEQAPPIVGAPAVFLPTTDEVRQVMDQPLLRYAVPYDVGNSGTEHHGNSAVFCVHTPVTIALAAYAGDDASYPTKAASKTPAQQLIAQLKLWGNDGQTAPAGRAGYTAQFEIAFVATVAIARNIPEVWNALDEIEQIRLDLCMKGCMLGSCFVASDRHPFPAGFGPGRERTVRGYHSSRTSAANFSTPPRLIPLVVAHYMGGPQVAMNWLDTFDQPAFADAVGNAGGLEDLWQTYRRQWTKAVQDDMHKSPSGAGGDGPTAEQIAATIANVTITGFTLAQTQEIIVAEISHFFRRTIKVGVTGQPGAETGPGVDTPYGLKGPFTDNVLRGCIADKNAWAGLPNAGLVGMADELDTRDGGGPAGGPKVRSAMSYVHQGLNALLMGAVTLAVQNAFSPAEPGVVQARERMDRGVRDLKYREEHGYRSYSKGGKTTNNEDWTPAWADSRPGGGFKLLSRYGLHRIFNTWLES